MRLSEFVAWVADDVIVSRLVLDAERGVTSITLDRPLRALRSATHGVIGHEVDWSAVERDQRSGRNLKRALADGGESAVLDALRLSPMGPPSPPNRFLPVMPTAVPWRERIYTDPLAYALRVQQATDAEAADVFAAEVDRLMRELRKALELTVRPVRPFDPPGNGWSGMYTEPK